LLQKSSGEEFGVISNAVLTNSYDLGFNPDYKKLSEVSKIQRLETITPEKPQKDNRLEDSFVVTNKEENTRFKTYTKKEVEDFFRGAKEAAVIFNQWKHEITESAADFIHSFKGELKELAEPITETYKDKISDSLEQFIAALKIELEVSLEKSPKGPVKKHMMSATELLGTIREVLWRQIEFIARDHVPAVADETNNMEMQMKEVS
jgi:hypothetical protein